MQMILNWGVGLSNVIFNPINLLLLLAGTLLGMIVGALPGLNSPIAMSIMIPLTYGMDPGSALCILAGIYTGSTCGGSISSILLEVPGTGAAVVTAFDGHQMYKKGQGGLALGISSVSSVVGGIVAGLLFWEPAFWEPALRLWRPRR